MTRSCLKLRLLRPSNTVFAQTLAELRQILKWKCKVYENVVFLKKGNLDAKVHPSISVILQPFKEEPPADFKCRDKFLVQTAVIKPAYESLNVAEMVTESLSRDNIIQLINIIYTSGVA